MVKKNVAIALAIIALVLVSVAIYTYISSEHKAPVQEPILTDNQKGQVGVTIQPPEVEDRGDGS